MTIQDIERLKRAYFNCRGKVSTSGVISVALFIIFIILFFYLMTKF